ncbi:FHA domain-containing protein [Micromonospora sp. WMMD1082]|uniref:FHA domain-containing protein n=1 Tax=Micromonospora sp. WMMD1082 TaxID=3016104 RepID=UPI002415D77B|nr:FHA domain-containing protein [Micromonospora sp. WMMD1082]MDG4795897.1 FHA domain-containing protein [Micromonospora sp. WMMD1082]
MPDWAVEATTQRRQAGRGWPHGVEGRLSMEEHPQLMPLLTVAAGPMRGLGFRLLQRPQVIGRDPAVDIVVHDPHLSRRHAEIWLAGEGVSVVDLGSTNGTWVNDLRTTGVARLTDGDVIRIGRTELRFFDPGVARTDPVSLSFELCRQERRPTLPLPVAVAPVARGKAGAPVTAAVAAGTPR